MIYIEFQHQVLGGLEMLDYDFVFDGQIDLFQKIRKIWKMPIETLNTKIQRFVALTQEQFSARAIAKFVLHAIGEEK